MEVTLDAAVTQRDNISLLDGYYRERLHGRKGGCDLVCRPISASGKSNITDLFEKGLHKKGFSTYLLGAENL